MIALVIIGGVALFALVAFVAFSVGLSRAAKMPNGAPTPAEAKIQIETQAQLDKNAQAANAAAEEVAHASKSDLVRLGREQLQTANPAAPSSPKPVSKP